MQHIVYPPLAEVHWLDAVLGLSQDRVHIHGWCEGPNVMVISFLLDNKGREH